MIYVWIGSKLLDIAKCKLSEIGYSFLQANPTQTKKINQSQPNFKLAGVDQVHPFKLHFTMNGRDK